MNQRERLWIVSEVTHMKELKLLTSETSRRARESLRSQLVSLSLLALLHSMQISVLMINKYH